jgi:predicted nucleotidyltransferase
LQKYLQHLTDRLRDVLGDGLFGVYAGGSVALGDYVPGRSDVDVAAICAVPLEESVKRAVGEALRHEALPCPARGLEFVVYSRDAARSPEVEAGFELDLNSGAEMPFRLLLDSTAADRHWYPIDRAILAAHGVALAGPPAAEVFAAPPRELLLPLVAEAVRRHDVLNACRALHYEREGRWSSKTTAGIWALGVVENPDPVRRALACRGTTAIG